MIKDIVKKIIPAFLIDWYHFFLAFLAAFFYRFPSRLRPAFAKASAGKQGYGGQARKIKVIGVTGTNGKSTVVDLTTRIFEEAGYQVASLSSIKFKIKDKEWPNTLRMTMPGRFQIQKFLREAVNSRCQYAILEVTSEGVKQYRHKFINFSAAVFTNLALEHIETHGSFEKYREAKGKLFQATKGIHIINLDDENADYFWKIPAKKKIGFTALEKNSGRASVEAENIRVLSSGLKFSVKDTEFNLQLLANFNVYNALSAISVGLSQDIDLETCKKALEKVKGIPGRMEEVISEPFRVFVDYAFTPYALEKVYQALKTNNQQLKTARMICVLGACGGGRDKWKRPVLGQIAAKYCEEIIITNEDPYDEDPDQILSMLKSGISKSQFPMSNFYEILDRREAIKKSLELAKAGDIVIITGKGCEPSICVKGGKKIPWDDRKVIKEEFSKITPAKLVPGLTNF